MSNWTQPICDDCFKEMFPNHPGPTRIKDEFRQDEKCCWCGTFPIRNGLYVRINPTFAKYPTLESK